MNAFRVYTSIPKEVGVIHFIGIGGIGMSGIAEILHNLGYRVQGTDTAEGYIVTHLRELGIPVSIGHDAAHLGEAKVVVRSTAVPADNPEIVAARERRIPVVRRSEMLCELLRMKMPIAVAGTHGKTTTTALTAALLDAGGFDPTVINGGVIHSYGSNVRLGESDWVVAEADESDGTFLQIPARVAIVTNIDPEHLEHYGSFDGVREAFQRFVQGIPFYGFAVLCIDHPEVEALAARITDRRIITYGTHFDAMVRAEDVESSVAGSTFTVVIRTGNVEKRIRGMRCPVPGMHNVRNSLAAIAVAETLGISEEAMLRGLSQFRGVKRRFTLTGEVEGVTVIDDYGHHPAEIMATLKAARSFRSSPDARVIAVVQPHRYSRLHGLFDEFCHALEDADIALIADVYAAGEAPIPGADRDALVEGIRATGHKQVEALPNREALAGMIRERARPGDLVVCLGAGSITYWAQSLPQELAALGSKAA
jgi:UDP-N-acetylmuramate--alanine ligase